MNREYSIRTGFIFLLFCAAYSLILINLYCIQIKDRDFYLHLGQQQYNVTIKKTPPRALVYDRNQQILALNKNSIAAFTLPRKLEDQRGLVSFLEKQFPQAVERLHTHKDNYFMYIKRKLTQDQLDLIQSNTIKDIHLIEEPSRYYPLDGVGPLVGITDVDNNGLFGIEQIYNDQLAGEPTTYSLQKDARSGFFYFKKETRVEGTQGSPITLTIDGNLQFLAYETLKETVAKYHADEGAVLVMDPQTGDIITIAHFPDFDPNSTEAIVQDHTKIKALTDVHELGSVMKVFVTCAALEEGVVTPNEMIDCRNTKSSFINGMPVNTWKEHGVLPFTEVIQVSNNIGIALVTQRLGTKLYDHYKRWGFGKKTGINFPGEQKGMVTHPTTWSKQSLISLSFGYEINATLLQLASAFCTIANGGFAVQPRLILNETPTKKLERLYSASTIETIQDILEKTVTQGTAKRAALKGYRVMGKTGTANLITNGQYDKTRNIYTFAGIVQKDSYKRVIVTFIKNAHRGDLYASQVAVPLFERIMEHVIIHDKVL